MPSDPPPDMALPTRPASSPADEPRYYADRDAMREEAFRLLARAVKDRRSPMHTVVLASIGRDGFPEARVMVLRGFDPVERWLRVHTDRRSPKIRQIEADPRVTVLAYDPTRKIQVRICGEAQVYRDGPEWQAAWATTRPFSRECYQVTTAPGKVLARPDQVRFSRAESREGEDFFAIVRVRVMAFQVLYLAASGHRRAEFRWDGGEWKGDWLVP